MAYKLRYTWNIDWVEPGQGPGQGQVGGSQTFQGPGSTGPGETQIVSLTVPGSGSNNAITAADINTLTAAMAATIIAQANASLQTLQSFAAGYGSGGGVIGS